MAYRCCATERTPEQRRAKSCEVRAPGHPEIAGRPASHGDGTARIAVVTTSHLADATFAACRVDKSSAERVGYGYGNQRPDLHGRRSRQIPGRRQPIRVARRDAAGDAGAKLDASDRRESSPDQTQ